MEGELTLAERWCLVELSAVCGVYSEEMVCYVVEEMLESRMDFGLCFRYLCNVGYKGMELLVSLAKQDFKEMPVMILDHLARTEQIME